MVMIKNDIEWDIIIPTLMANAMNDVVDHALDVLKGYIESEVYKYSPKEAWYDRTMEFLNSWDKVKSSLIGKSQSIEFGYLPDNNHMYSYPASFQHGSYFWKGGTDSREYLADFIFKGVAAYDGDGRNSLFGEIPARDAWTPFKAEFDASWQTWWANALKKQGLII